MIASPLHKAASQSKHFIWTNECQGAFDTLRTILTSETVLIYPDFSKPFRLETDACN